MYTIKLLILSTLTVYFVDCAYGRLRKSSQPVLVKELSISSSVSIRYANVLVRSLVENLENTDNEVSFQVRIPREAYITSFVIVTNGKTIKALIKERNAAEEDYNKAKDEGASAGTVTQQSNVADDIDRNIFNVKVNVAAQTPLEFRLQYEELVQKRAGKYIQKIFVDSDHVIPQLNVTCEFKEKQKFKQLSYQTPIDVKNVDLNEVEVTKDGYFIKKIVWRPSESEQENAQFGLEKPFEISYELDQPENGGTVYINDNGEFVHMFSTPCVKTKIMIKQIVFVIDISGSMATDPIKQVRQTMKEILSKLLSNDYFNIALFSGNTKKWMAKFQQATPYNVARAKEFIKDEVKAAGSTNINDALLKAIGLFDQESEFAKFERLAQIVVFLTDGSATAGVTDRNQIRSNVREKNYYEGKKCCKSTIYTVAFGVNADIDFLRILANEHEGKLTIIRETNDDGELLEVYRGIEHPYLKNIEFTYTVGSEVVPKANMTRSYLRQYDCSEEFVVGGWTFPKAEIHSVITAFGIHDNVTFNDVPTVRARNVTAKTLSRLLVYERVQQLLTDAETTTDPYRARVANEQALELSLEYGFVTPLTSLVVTEYSPNRMTAVRSKNIKDTRSGHDSARPVLRRSFSLPNDLYVQDDADDMFSYDDLDPASFESSFTPDSNTNASNKCTYSINLLLIVLVEVIYSFEK